LRHYHILTVTHELAYSPVHNLILPDICRQTLREARELKGDNPFYGDHTVQFLGSSSSLQNAKNIAKTAPCMGVFRI